MYLQVAHVVIHVGVLVGAIDAHPQVAIAQAADGDTLVQGMRAPDIDTGDGPQQVADMVRLANGDGVFAQVHRRGADLGGPDHDFLQFCRLCGL